MPDLPRQAAQFADAIQQLVNGTVCDGITIRAIVIDEGRMLVGHGLTKDELVCKPFRLRIGRGRPHGWLDVSYRLVQRDTVDTIAALTWITCEHAHAGIKTVTATIRTVTQKATGHHH